MIKAYISILRPQQYIKNLFIFLPPIFGLKGTDISLLDDLSLSFVAFSLLASAVYIFNDLIDVKLDQIHPFKKKRPIASGDIIYKAAALLSGILALLGLGIAYFQGILLPFMIYLFLNILYSLKLKHIAIVDVFIIAFGFVIRIVVGAMVTSVVLSKWIILMTFLLAVFLGFSKRKEGLILSKETDTTLRPVLNGYNQTFLTTSMGIMAAIVIVSYIMYTTSQNVVNYTQSDKLYITTVFVLFGILRYLKITLVNEERNECPTNILIRDKWLQLSILAWISSFIWILYA